MRKAWTLPKELSSTPAGVKLPWPADTPASCGPPVNSQGRTKWRPPRWAPLSNLMERSPTRQVGSSSHSPPVFSVPPATELTNCGAERLQGKPTRTLQGVSLHPPQLVHGRHNSPIPGPATREVQPRQIRRQPHGSSYFLPGKIAGKPANFLLDSGCTTNIL